MPRPPLIVTELTPAEMTNFSARSNSGSPQPVGRQSRTSYVPALAPGPTSNRSLSAVSLSGPSVSVPAGSAPLMTTLPLETVIGSRPAYVNATPSISSVPEWTSVGFDTMLRRWPSTTSESNPPAPPSAVPVTAPPGLSTNVSLLSAAPTRFSKPTNATPPIVPVPVAVIAQVESAAGPCSESAEPPATSFVVCVNVTVPTPPPVTVPAASPVSVQSDGAGRVRDRERRAVEGDRRGERPVGEVRA